MAPSKTIPWRKDGILEGSIKDTGSTGDVSFTVSGSSSEKITVNYGDGTSETKTLNNGSFSHTYPANSGPFRITVSGALFDVEQILNLPGFQMKGLINTPKVTDLRASFGSTPWQGSLDFIQFTPDIERLDLLNIASSFTGSIDVFSQLNGKLGKNDKRFRVFSPSQISGDVSNFQFLHPDLTRIDLRKAEISGDIFQIFSFSNLSNLSILEVNNNSLSGSSGDSTRSVTQTAWETFNVANNSVDVDTDLFSKPVFSSLKNLNLISVKSITNNDSFLQNLSSLEQIRAKINIGLSKLVPFESSLQVVLCDRFSDDLSNIGNNTFDNLINLTATLGSNCTGDIQNLDKPAIENIEIKKSSVNGTIKFTQNQNLKKINLSNNDITDIDNANNNYNLDRLKEFNIQGNNIPQTPVSDWWIFNDDSTLNVPGSNETYVMDSSGNNMGTLTAAAQTAANNIASKGWTTSFNS